MWDIDCIFISNDVDMASFADSIGVQRIMVDLEIDGKIERQGHLDTVISRHEMSDVPLIKNKLNNAQLLVRINPINDKSYEEINEVIKHGADIIMLPMFRSKDEVETFIRHVGGRATTCLLLETATSLVRIDDILRVEGIDEIHVGLNDLHLELKLDFMFEPLALNILDELSEKVQAKGIKFGFGGIARLGYGDLPAEKILAEHRRLNSSMVILSRAFSIGLSQEEFKLKFLELMKYWEELLECDNSALEENRGNIKDIVNNLVSGRK